MEFLSPVLHTARFTYMNYRQIMRFISLTSVLWIITTGTIDAAIDMNTPAMSDVGDPGDPYNPPVGPPEPVIPPSKLLNFDSPIRIPGEYMITFKGDGDLAKDVPTTLLQSLSVGPGILPNTPASITALANAMSAWYQQKEKIPNTILGIWTLGGLRGFAVRGISDSDIAELAQDPRIKFIEPNMSAKAETSIQNTGKPGCGGSACAPWHLDRIDQERGTDGLYHYDADGSGVFIALIDSGLQENHTEFANVLSEDDDCTGAFNCVQGISDPAKYDCYGHGTEVASVIAGATFGVAKNPFFISSYGVFDCSGSATSTSVTLALQQMMADGGPDDGIPVVANMSLTFVGGNSDVDNAVSAAVDAGFPVVVAAGNQGGDACNNSPARNPKAIRVAATDITDTRWIGVGGQASNYGSCVDIFAPGAGVVTADNGGNIYNQPGMTACATTFPNTTATCSVSGTSVAAPIVTGIAALFLQNNRTASPGLVKNVILASSLLNVVNNPGAGSPNLLSYIGVPGNTDGLGGNGVTTPYIIIVPLIAALL